jgi:hypothetical protein
MLNPITARTVAPRCRRLFQNPLAVPVDRIGPDKRPEARNGTKLIEETGLL